MMMNTDTQINNAPFVGVIMQQSGEPFSDTSLSGTTSVIYATGLSGGTPPTANTLVGLVQFTSPNNYAFDADQSGNGTISTQSDTGTFSVAANGRLTLTSSGSGGGHNPTIYLVKPGKGFLVGTDNSVTVGSFEPQSAGPFSNASVSGVFGFGSILPAEPNVDYQEGWVNFNAAGTVSGESDNITLGSAPSVGGTFSQDYSVASNGRGTVFKSGLSTTPNVIFYVVSATKAVLMKAYSGSGTQVSSNPEISVAQK